MDIVTTVNSITTWVNNKLIKTTYEHNDYSKGNSVTKVSYQVIAEVYDKNSKLEKMSKQGTNIDINA